MKKLILLALTAVMMAGCDTRVKTDITQSPTFEYRTYIIDSCEYIGRLVYDFDYAERNFLAHKGNCRFCKERRQKELEELLVRIKREVKYKGNT